MECVWNGLDNCAYLASAAHNKETVVEPVLLKRELPIGAAPSFLLNLENVVAHLPKRGKLRQGVTIDQVVLADFEHPGRG